MTPLIKRGDMAWRRRMRERQPDMQRHQARFRSSTDQHKAENDRSDTAEGGWRAHVREGITAIRPSEMPKASSSASVPKLAMAR